MMFLVMYDISDTKVRNMISKYLLRKGCSRVQNSVFLADLTIDKYRLICNDMRATFASNEYDDSVVIVPVSSDNVENMSIIGRKIDIDFIRGTKKVVFF